jgi:filamentous hemagglutinin
MNRHCHRIIFNKARGALMAVAENATSQGRSSSETPAGGSGPGPWNTLAVRPMALAIAAVLSAVLMAPTAQAQITADPGAPGRQRPTVLTAPNGVPLVNIQTPSAAGVSRNTYSQFDVQHQGAILNNARTDAQTQLGGWVHGNPWLAAGGARVILNEVNASSPSLLRGFIEVAGQRAQVVVAIPAGISCDGCGFINASRATLTTGTPVFSSGDLEGYRVQGGSIAITGSGLDASGADYTDIIARAVQIQGGVWSRQLKVVAGANQVDVDPASGEASVRGSVPGTDAPPAYAIDTGVLGGMYAGKIALVATDAGVGVRHAGTMYASAGEVAITADGRLENAGHIASLGDARIDARAGIQNNGTIYTQATAALGTRGAIDNRGVIAAQRQVVLDAGQVDNSAGTISSAQGGVTVLVAGGLSNQSGRIEAAQQVRISAAGIDNRGGVVLGGSVLVDGGLHTLDNTGGKIAASGTAEGDPLSIRSGAVANESGVIQSAAALSIDTHGQRLGNAQGGQIAGNGSVSIAASSLDNRGGTLQSLGDVVMGLGGALDNTQGLVRAGQDLRIAAASITNADTAAADQGLEGGHVALTAAAIVNIHGAVRANASATLTSSGTIDNSSGLVSAGTALTLKDPAAPRTLSIVNTGGTLIAGQQLVVHSAELTGDGQLLSQQDLSIDVAGDLIHSGRIAANRQASITTGGTLTNRAEITAGTTLSVDAAAIDNQSSGSITGAQVHLQAGQSLTNRGLIAGGDAVIRSAAVTNVGTGRIYGDRLAIGAATLHNQAENGTAPVIAARDRLDLGAGVLRNSGHALLFSAGDLAIGGDLDAAGQASGQATLVHNHGATIEALGSVAISTQALRNTNADFSTTAVELPKEEIVEYQGAGSPNRYVPGRPDTYIFNDESDHLHTPEGQYENWSAYRYERITTETRVLTSDPGRILSGGGMRLAADTVLNDKSQIIAGGTLTGEIGTLTNTEVAGERVITDVGTVTSYWRDHQKGRDSTGSKEVAYTPAPVIQAISLTPTVYQQNTVSTGSGTHVAALSTSTVHQVPGTPGAPTGASPGITPITQVEIDADGSVWVVRSGGINTRAPDSRLFGIAPDPHARYLIETDPAFANYRSWLSSDYLLQGLATDPAATQKRLGDGFYEQKLVREQLAQLTGRRFLEGYADDEAQYLALMDSGLAFAQAHRLVPGVALSATQMAALTSDIVWLVEQEITLPGGGTTRALVPQLYARVQQGDLQSGGALIVGGNVQLDLTGDLRNGGTIAGREVVAITSENIHNVQGRILGEDVGLAARADLNNIAGTIAAGNSLAVSAGRDLTVESTTRTQSSAQGQRVNIDRIAGLYVSNPSGGTLVASAGRDVHLVAAGVQNLGSGATAIVAGNDLRLDTVTQSQRQHIAWDDKNQRSDVSSAEIGTSVQAKGDVALHAGRDLIARAATVSSGQGAMTAVADRDIRLEAGNATTQVDEAHQHTGRSSALAKKTISTRDTLDQGAAVGSTVSGSTVHLQVGRDIRLVGSNAVSDQGTTLVAQNDLSITAATNTSTESHWRDEKKSGIFSGGGLSVTAGTQQQTVEQRTMSRAAAASTVGSTSGDVRLLAGHNYTQTGSDVLAPQGSIDIAAQRVQITEARETSDTQAEVRFKQSGVTLAVSGGVISAVQTAQQMASAAKDTSDPRMKALAAANVAFAADNAVSAVRAGQGSTINGKQGQIATGRTNPDGSPETRDADAADKAGGIDLSISLGSSRSESKTVQSADASRGSTLAAGKDIRITARGAEQASDILLRGSGIHAGHGVNLDAENDVHLLAARNTAEQHSTNKSTSASVGISIGTSGLLFTASASGARGHADGSDVTWSHSHVGAGDQVTITSGGDTTLRGAVVSAPRVAADVGGSLTIESLQDTSRFDSKQQSIGASVSIGAGKMGGNLSASKSKVHSDYASVGQQSGIRAGDEGFQVQVGGDTQLIGGAITSTQGAVEAGKNSFTTGGTLSATDIHNHASYQASSVGISIGTGTSIDGKLAPQGTGAGIGKDGGNASSVTRAAISGIAGDQDARTGDAETGIARIFDAGKVQKEIDAQVAITQTFGREASQAVGAYAQKQLERAEQLRVEAAATEDPASRSALEAEATRLTQDWGADGRLRVAAHAVIGGLTGGTSGAAGSAVGTLTAPAVRQALAEAGVDSSLASTLTAMASAAGGGAVGGTSGAATALNEVANNYLKHEEAKRLDQLEMQKLTGRCDSSCEGEIRQLKALDAARNRELASCEGATTAACDAARREVRFAAAEYVRSIGPTASIVYVNERNETTALARQTMDGFTVWEVAKAGVGSVLEGFKETASAAFTGFKAVVLQDEAAQSRAKAALGSAWEFVRDPENWPQLLGAMSTERREELAAAYEKGDGQAVAAAIGEQLASIPVGGPTGTLKVTGRVTSASKGHHSSGASTTATSAKAASEAILAAPSSHDVLHRISSLTNEGHALARHGGAVTDDQLIARARTGIAPDLSVDVRDGKVQVPRASTAFYSDELLARSDLFVRTQYLEQARIAQPAAIRLTIIGVDVGQPVGRGYGRHEGPTGRFRAATLLRRNQQSDRDLLVRQGE